MENAASVSASLSCLERHASILEAGPGCPAAAQLHQLVHVASLRRPERPPAGWTRPQSQQKALGWAKSASGGASGGPSWINAGSKKWHRLRQREALPVEQLRDAFVSDKVLFVCRIPLGPKCVKSHVRQYEAAEHLLRAPASPLRFPPSHPAKAQFSGEAGRSYLQRPLRAFYLRAAHGRNSLCAATSITTANNC